jgi:hypothetical protein
MRDAMMAGMIALAAMFGTAAPAGAGKLPTTTVAEFDQQSDVGKGETVRVALATFHDFYANKKQDAAKAACIVGLFKSAGAAAPIPDGYIYLDLALKTLRGMPVASRPSVERVIYNIIQDRCAPASSQGSQPPAPAEQSD